MLEKPKKRLVLCIELFSKSTSYWRATTNLGHHLYVQMADHIQLRKRKKKADPAQGAFLNTRAGHHSTLYVKTQNKAPTQVQTRECCTKGNRKNAFRLRTVFITFPFYGSLTSVIVFEMLPMFAVHVSNMHAHLRVHFGATFQWALSMRTHSRPSIVHMG